MDIKLIAFIVLSLPVIAISWYPLMNRKSHGFYRFFGWEGVLWLTVNTYNYWFHQPFSPAQIISWSLLAISAYLVIAGYLVMRRQGKPSSLRNEKELFHFEKTTRLIDYNVFKYIRHPLYGSLIFVTWALYLKHITLTLTVVSIISTVLFYITMLYEEKESLAYFGDAYKTYMSKTKRFIPFIV